MSSFKRVRVELELTPTVFKDYTAKIVKSYLICVDPSFKEVFSTEGGLKEVHITPLLDERGHAIYPKRVVKCSFCKDSKPGGEGEVKLPKRAYFELSGPEELVMRAFSFGDCKLKLGKAELEIKSLGAEEFNVEVELSEAVSIKFRGPAVLRDPWLIGRGLRTRFLPTPINLFSTNAYFLYREKYKEVLMEIDESLVEDHSSLHSVGKVWYYYSGKWLPALSGSLLLWVRKESEVVKEVLYHAALLGVGSGRAAGFGDVLVSSVV